MIILSNAKQYYKGYITQIETPLKGGKGKWEQFSRQKAVPRDAVGFARHLKIELPVLLHLLMVHQEDLLKSTIGRLVPGSLEINPIRVTTNQMFRENHDKSLEYDQEKVFLISLSGL